MLDTNEIHETQKFLWFQVYLVVAPPVKFFWGGGNLRGTRENLRENEKMRRSTQKFAIAILKLKSSNLVY